MFIKWSWVDCDVFYEFGKFVYVMLNLYEYILFEEEELNYDDCIIEKEIDFDFFDDILLDDFLDVGEDIVLNIVGDKDGDIRFVIL